MPILHIEKLEKADLKCDLKETDLITSFENGMSVTRSSTSSALDLESEDRKKKNEIVLK